MIGVEAFGGTRSTVVGRRLAIMSSLGAFSTCGAAIRGRVPSISGCISSGHRQIVVRYLFGSRSRQALGRSISLIRGDVSLIACFVSQIGIDVALVARLVPKMGCLVALVTRNVSAARRLVAFVTGEIARICLRDLGTIDRARPAKIIHGGRRAATLSSCGTETT